MTTIELDAAGTVTPTWKAIAASWLALKTWVKVWLFFLNGVFLAAFAFAGEPLAAWTLVAYTAAGPVLAGIMIAQRGLSRLLGVAHLIPWVPLVVYLGTRLLSDAAGPRITADTPALFAYTIVLLASVVVCLAFDTVDVVRWWRGERYLMGSPEAVRAGASGPAPVL